MDTTPRIPVPADDGGLRIERDELGRAYWADTGARITAADVVTCGEDGEPNMPLIDALIEDGLWVVRDGNEVLVTPDAIEVWVQGL